MIIYKLLKNPSSAGDQPLFLSPRDFPKAKFQP